MGSADLQILVGSGVLSEAEMTSMGKGGGDEALAAARRLGLFNAAAKWFPEGFAVRTMRPDS